MPPYNDRLRCACAAIERIRTYCIKPYLQVGLFPRIDLVSRDVARGFCALLRVTPCARAQDGFSPTAQKQATGCTKLVPILGVCALLVTKVDPQIGKRLSDETRPQCPTVLTRRFTDPHSHTDLTARLHKENHRDCSEMVFIDNRTRCI
jgi:hypothetical protein